MGASIIVGYNLLKLMLNVISLYYIYFLSVMIMSDNWLGKWIEHFSGYTRSFA